MGILFVRQTLRYAINFEYQKTLRQTKNYGDSDILCNTQNIAPIHVAS